LSLSNADRFLGLSAVMTLGFVLTSASSLSLSPVNTAALARHSYVLSSQHWHSGGVGLLSPTCIRLRSLSTANMAGQRPPPYCFRTDCPHEPKRSESDEQQYNLRWELAAGRIGGWLRLSTVEQYPHPGHGGRTGGGTAGAAAQDAQ
jgi:hypothetical protein